MGALLLLREGKGAVGRYRDEKTLARMRGLAGLAGLAGPAGGPFPPHHFRAPETCLLLLLLLAAAALFGVWLAWYGVWLVCGTGSGSRVLVPGLVCLADGGRWVSGLWRASGRLVGSGLVRGAVCVGGWAGDEDGDGGLAAGVGGHNPEMGF